MSTVPLRDAERDFADLARRAEKGETIVITREGRPVFDLVPHRGHTTLDLSAVARFKAEHGVEYVVGRIPDDFDDPLPEDFLIRPLPLEP